ncbi:hypothetical protein FVE85_3956 [Porphyridium purpureum]|uniref:Uncharacterized protein n=1 Tax=Porphyridium purpureum TaxID=35688 RepID=A0A5J4YR79_PORPP|nr:hypothetical protein FVE85_3956 [Porphyridium purpureum]|eukprot:POR6159..scf229_5
MAGRRGAYRFGATLLALCVVLVLAASPSAVSAAAIGPGSYGAQNVPALYIKKLTPDAPALELAESAERDGNPARLDMMNDDEELLPQPEERQGDFPSFPSSIPTISSGPETAGPTQAPEDFELSTGQIVGLAVSSGVVVVLLLGVFSFSVRGYERMERWGL